MGRKNLQLKNPNQKRRLLQRKKLLPKRNLMFLRKKQAKNDLHSPTARTKKCNYHPIMPKVSPNQLHHPELDQVEPAELLPLPRNTSIRILKKKNLIIRLM